MEIKARLDKYPMSYRYFNLDNIRTSLVYIRYVKIQFLTCPDFLVTHFTFIMQFGHLQTGSTNLPIRTSLVLAMAVQWLPMYVYYYCIVLYDSIWCPQKPIVSTNIFITPQIFIIWSEESLETKLLLLLSEVQMISRN